MNVYCNIPKLYDSLNIVVIMQKKWIKKFFYRIMPKKDTDRIVNSEYPD